MNTNNILERTNVKNRSKFGQKKEQMFDELDRKIIRELLADSRLSYRQIARRIGISPGTVLKRIKRLEGVGIIKYYTVVLDHEKLGYDLAAIIELTISKGKLIDVEKEIAKYRSVLGVYDVTGTTDAIILAKFKTRRELNNFVKKILAMELVERTNTRVILNTIKEDFRLL
jgi:DNA-binding Lrp family transcriptional regulator